MILPDEAREHLQRGHYPDKAHFNKMFKKAKILTFRRR